MAKRLVAKTGEYQKEGQTKGEYTKIGVMLSNNNGEYMLLDPSVSLAGVLAKQNALAMIKGEQVRDNVMVSIFEDENQSQGQNQSQSNQNQGGYQAPPQGGYNQGGYQNNRG